MLMVVQSCERNFADQRLVEFELLQKHGVKMIRASLMVCVSVYLQYIVPAMDMHSLTYATHSRCRHPSINIFLRPLS